MDDKVPTHRAERITYLLRPVHLDIHLQETNTRIRYTVSPLTQVSHLKQLIEVYLHISKHHLIIPEAETEFVTALPYPLFIGFPPHDHSDNATFASPLTDHTSTSSAQHASTRFAIEDEHHRFLTIPDYYWFNDLDFQSLRRLFCPKHIQWFSPQSLLAGDAITHTQSSFLTCFVFDHHWYAAFYQPNVSEQTTPRTTLFVSPSSNSQVGLLDYIAPYLPASVFGYEYVPDTTVGLCGPALLQTLINTLIQRLRPSYEDPIRPYHSFDFSQEALFQQAYDIRRKHPRQHSLCQYRAGGPTSDSPPPPPTPIYKQILALETEEHRIHLLTVTHIDQFPVPMRRLSKRELPPPVPSPFHRSIFNQTNSPIPPHDFVHATFFAFDTLWRKCAVLPARYSHWQRIQLSLPGITRTMYESIDYRESDTWVPVTDYTQQCDSLHIQYRFQFHKFLVPIHLVGTETMFLMEVWPWFTIGDLQSCLYSTLHLPFGSLTNLDYDVQCPLATITHRNPLAFQIRHTADNTSIPPTIVIPEEIQFRTTCWCRTMCRNTYLGNIQPNRVHAQLYLEHVFVMLPHSRQLILVHYCRYGTFEQLLNYLSPSKTLGPSSLVVGDLNIFSLTSHLPPRDVISFICYLPLPRSSLRFPTIDDPLSFFRLSSDSDFAHVDFVPIQIIWITKTNGDGLTRTAFAPPNLTISDVIQFLSHFCGPHYEIFTNTALPAQQPIRLLPDGTTFTIRQPHEHGYRPIEELTYFLQHNLKELPREHWFTEVDIVLFQCRMRKHFPQLHPIKVLDYADLALQIVDKSWATATIINQTWIPLYFDHILQTLTIGLPHDWNPMQRAAIFDTLKPTFTKFDYRPMPLVPEGWCGPLTIAYLFFWLGIHEGEPIEQLQTIHELALSQHNRIHNNREAKFVAGGPKHQITIPRILTPEISQIAFRTVFFPHDAIPQPYSYKFGN